MGEIVIQATLLTVVFGAVIGVYIFSINQVNNLRNKTVAKQNNIVERISSLELVVTNHCSVSELKLERIENDIVEIKTMVKDIYGGSRG